MAGYFDSPSLPKMRLERKGHQIEQMALVLAHSVKFILPGLASCCGILLGQRPTLPFFADGPGLAHASELSKRTIFSRYVMSLASHLVDSHPVIKKKKQKKRDLPLVAYIGKGNFYCLIRTTLAVRTSHI